MTQETETDRSESTMSRRMLIAGIGVAAVSGFGAGQASAQTAEPEGRVGSLANPYEIAFIERIVFTQRTTEPSSPEDGTIVYNTEA